MPDIFISYAKEDRDRARTVAEALTEKGWSVWWDPTIAPGQTWAQVIEEQIKAAKCIVVLWTKSSVSSRWVRKEARFGLNRDILIPALIDDVELPFEFEDVEAARLVGWSGGPHREFDLLAKQVAVLAGEPTRSPEGASLIETQEEAHRHRVSGEAYIDRGESQRGVAELEQAMSGFEASEQWGPATAVVDVILQFLPDSIVHHQKRVEFAARGGDNEQLIRAMLDLADTLQRTGSGERARITYQQVLDLDPEDTRAREALGIQTTEPAATPRDEQQEPEVEAVRSSDLRAGGSERRDHARDDIARARAENVEPVAVKSSGVDHAPPTTKPKIRPKKDPARKAASDGKELTTAGVTGSGELTLKSRIVVAGLLLLAVWFAQIGLRPWTGVFVGGVAVATILIRRLPLNLWPVSQLRDRFWVPGALAVVLIVLTLVPTVEQLGFDIAPRGVYGLVFLAGVAAWVIAWGKTQQRPFAKWYLGAIIFAVAPAISMIPITMSKLSGFPVMEWLIRTHYSAIMVTAGSLVTYELALRRLLIGPPRNAHLGLVVGSAIVAGVLTAIQTWGNGPGMIVEFILTCVGAMVAGSLYVLSGSLLVAALYSGLATATRIAYDAIYYGMASDYSAYGGYGIIPPEGWGTTEGWGLIIVGGIFAAVLAYRVKSRTGSP